MKLSSTDLSHRFFNKKWNSLGLFDIIVWLCAQAALEILLFTPSVNLAFLRQCHAMILAACYLWDFHVFVYEETQFLRFKFFSSIAPLFVASFASQRPSPRVNDTIFRQCHRVGEAASHLYNIYLALRLFLQIDVIQNGNILELCAGIQNRLTSQSKLLMLVRTHCEH